MSEPRLNRSPSRRPMVSLDGPWDFAFEGATAKLVGEKHRIRSPGLWQTQFPALRNAQGIGRYRKTVDLPTEWKDKRSSS